MKNQAGSIVATGDNYGFIDVLRGVSGCLVIAAPGLRGLPFLAAVFGLTFLLAALSWHLLEKPVSAFFRARVARSHRSGNVQLAAQLP